MVEIAWRRAAQSSQSSPKPRGIFLLLFHELATNAAKYGALSCMGGKVIVEWRLNRDRRLTLKWIETGGPKIDPPATKGFGSQLILHCVKELSGVIDSDYPASGFTCSITIQLGKD